MLPPRLGPYEPLLELAAGGMATVFVARQLGGAGFERLVAIKRVHRHLLDNREFFDMFRDEARLSSLIRHPNVVSATDVVESGGELFIVMDYVESVSLARVVRTTPSLPPPIASRIVADLLGGLHAAHEAVDLRGRALGVVHRDVSPQNLVVAVDGTARVIDFGIAKAAARLAATTGGALRGKLRYMSPEQVKQQPLDRRADIFAAGIVLYEVLTGRRLFEGTDEADIALGVLLGEPSPPSALASGISPKLDAVVERALARNRDERYPTAAEMLDALVNACPPASHGEVARAVTAAAGDEIEARRAALRNALDAGPPLRAPTSLSAASLRARSDDTMTETLAATAERTPSRRRRPHVGVAFAFAATLAMVAVGFVRWRGGSSTQPTVASTVDRAPPAEPATSTISALPSAPPGASASASVGPSPPSASPPRKAAPKPRVAGDLHGNPYAR